MVRLVIDIGNTRTKLGVFNGRTLEDKSIHNRLSKLKVDKIIQTHKIKTGILSSTRRINNSVLQKFDSLEKLLVLDHSVEVPVEVNYETPETLGNDRLAAVVGVNSLFPKANSLVIDAGTCITLDILDKKGVYQGGVITPGLRMRLNAMHHFTGKLPSLSIDKPVQIGKSTKGSMLSGALDGTIFEIQGFIRRYKRMFGDLNVILTGGDRDFFANHLKRKIFVVPDLVLTGLNEILLYNGES